MNALFRLAGRIEPSSRRRWLGLVVVLAAGGWLWWGGPRLLGWAFEQYTGVVNRTLSFDAGEPLTESAFEALAETLTRSSREQRIQSLLQEEESPEVRRNKTATLLKVRSFQAQAGLPHIAYFRQAGIRHYEGPKTCLQCHERMKWTDDAGRVREVGTLQDVVDSVHFKFQQTAPGFTTYGYDGREVNAAGSRPIPMGKIDRACGIPGTFSWTGWAELIRTKPLGAAGKEVKRSEGCGQCHIGGNYHPATEKMLPFGEVPREAKEGIDCLICHARDYDFNQRYVLEDERGRRWHQDRTMRAALTVGQPQAGNCLWCHQHNLGGDLFAGNVAAQQLGHQNPRLLHKGAKRGTPFSPESDVHAAVGMICTDCHVPEGHKIPRGTKGTDLVANDLPGKVVACESCHTQAPHRKGDDRVLLNGHVSRLACESCHLPRLEENNVVLRDWTHPVWDEEEGLYGPADIYYSGKAGEGMIFLWFNGSGTFLANALGNHPDRGTAYNPLMVQMATLTNPKVVEEIREQVVKLKEKHPEIDVEVYMRQVTEPLSQLSPELLAKRSRVIEERMRPLMNQGQSRLYPFKLFNAMMYEDLGNEGPFGAMILPFDYPVYYETGQARQSVQKALTHPMVQRMYQLPFSRFMMDEFMAYFGVEKWSQELPLQEGRLVGVEPRWMRQMGTLMVNHGIRAEGRGCKQCHAKRGGVMPFEQLGYTPERVQELRNLKELQ